MTSVQLLGESAPLRALRERSAVVAPSRAPVLVLGEGGTGKELVARALHQQNPARAHAPLIVLDCGTLPPDRLEVELFGPSGALLAADGGTLILDEIGELPLVFQSRLLRAIERGEVRRQGTTVYAPIDVRLVSTSRQDLPRMIHDRAFREDLWYRIAPLTLRVPPLREHPDDIPALVEHWVGHPVDAETLAPLLRHTWPGNVRELRHRAEHFAAFGRFDTEAMEALSEVSAMLGEGALPPVVSFMGQRFPSARAHLMDAFERAYILAMVARFGPDARAISAVAGVDAEVIGRMLRRHVRRGER